MQTAGTISATLAMLVLGFISVAAACREAPAAPGAPQGSALREGTWGGQHVGLEATAKGGTLEYDCAHGTIDEAIALDRNGRFDVKGKHTAEKPGPRREGDENGRLARYTGQVTGDTMELTVTLTDTGETVGTFTLTHGKSPVIRKCL